LRSYLSIVEFYYSSARYVTHRLITYPALAKPLDFSHNTLDPARLPLFEVLLLQLNSYLSCLTTPLSTFFGLTAHSTSSTMSTFNPNAYGCPQRYTKKPLGGVGTSVAPVKPENKDLKPDIKNVKPEKKDLKSGDHVSKLFAQASARAVVTSVKPETKDPKSEKKDLKSGEQVSKLFALASARIGDGRDARNSVDGQLKTAKVEVSTPIQ
jgi:hypothetical protein